MSKNLIQDIRRDLDIIKSTNKMSLTEAIFGDNQEQPNNNMGFNGEDEEEPEMPTSQNREDGNDGEMSPMHGELPSEKASTGDGEIDNILSNIRLAVIKGLAKLAEKPESIEYDTLKKILTIVDKPIDQQQKQNAMPQQPNNMR